MNSSCNSSFGDLISQEPRWTPFHDRISAGTVERSTNSPIAKKKLGFKGLSDQAGSTSNIDDVIGVCSGKFETQDDTLSQAGVGASGDLLPQQPNLSPKMSHFWPLSKKRDDFHESQDIEDYEDELIHDPFIQSHDNIVKKLSADLVKVDAEEDFEIIAKQTNNSLNDVCSPIICGSVRSIPKTMLEPYSRVSSNSMERKELKQASLDLDIQNTNIRQMGEGSKGRKCLKDSMECLVGEANRSGHGVPVSKTNKSYKLVGGRNIRSGLHGWKRKYGTVVEIVKSEVVESSGPKRSRETRNMGEGKHGE